MTDAPEENGYSRKHYTLDKDSLTIVENQASNHHNGNGSEAVRASIRFRDRWQARNKSLPNEIMNVLDDIMSTVEELEDEVAKTAERLEDVEHAASAESEEDLNRNRQKRRFRDALSKTEGRRIDRIAEKTGLSLADAAAAAQELEDNGRIVRTNNEEKEVRFRRL